MEIFILKEFRNVILFDDICQTWNQDQTQEG